MKEGSGVSERPRLIFVPSPEYCGLSTYFQSYMFADLKRHCNWFSHGDNCDSLKKRVSRCVDKFTDPVSISFDGSSFDSNQHVENIRSVDGRIGSSFINRLKGYVQRFGESLGISRSEQDMIVSGVMNTIIDPNCTLTTSSLDWKISQEFYLSGTTFSGHPTWTTLGNTFRTYLYIEYMLEGIDHEVIVAGDDSVIFAERKDCIRI